MTKNLYECPSRLWNKFTEKQKRHYNTVYGESDKEFICPKCDVTDKEWEVARHNFAVISALDLRSKKQELKLWNYLRKKLSHLKDNNITAREIFERVTL